MEKTKIIVCGAGGRMGGRIIDLALADGSFEVTAGVETKERAAKPVSGVRVTDDLSAVISSADAVIDFTAPEATLHNLAVAEKSRRAIVIGTTGLGERELSAVRAAAAAIPVVFSPNMSVGVNLLFSLVGEIARRIPGYDIEIVEFHHNQKKDAPSGTAVRLAQIISGSLGRDLEKVGVYGRKGVVGARKKEEIGVLAVRAGDIVGDHTVYFAGPGERIEITHRAHSRDTLAAGALTAARWAARQKPGLYDMQDVLGLRKGD